jgi:1,4-dihydroxy-2-naphthoyl-CoA synthase
MVQDLLKAEQGTTNNESNVSSNSNNFQDISVSLEYGNVYKITLNRPAKYNAITVKVCIK